MTETKNDKTIELFAGLTREQAWLLICMMKNLSVMISGPAGCGKTHIIKTYLKHMSENKSENKKDVYATSSNLHSPLKNDQNIHFFHPWENPPKSIENKNEKILICDEFSSFTEEMQIISKKVSQTIITGDHTQSVKNHQYLNALKHAEKENFVHIALSKAFRAGNALAASTTDALLHGSMYATPGAYSKKDIEPVIIIDTEDILGPIIARIIRSATLNEKNPITIAARKKETIARLFAAKRNILRKNPKAQITITHIDLLQGLETDILIVAPQGQDEIDLALKCVGRARHRTELFLENKHPVLRSFFSLQSEKAKESSTWKINDETPNEIIMKTHPDIRTMLKTAGFLSTMNWKVNTKKG